MAKYSQEQLSAMSRRLIEARKVRFEDRNGQDRYFNFVMAVAVKTGTSPDHVERKIEEWAAL